MVLTTANFYQRGDRVEHSDELIEIWRQYKEEGTQEAREKLILHYAPLVKYVAGRVSSGLPANIEYSDLVTLARALEGRRELE